MIDNQGRCVITDHGAFVLFNCYGPAVTNITNDRFAFKMQFYEVRTQSVGLHLHPFSCPNKLMHSEVVGTRGKSFMPQSHIPSTATCHINAQPIKIRAACPQVLQHRIEGMLHAGRPAVVAGDLNIAPYPIDHCDFVKAPAYIQAGMLTNRPDRAWFRRMLQEEGGPMVDLFRHASACFFCTAKQPGTTGLVLPVDQKRQGGIS